MTCAKSGEQSLCKLDNSGECCQPDSEGQCRCAELSNSNTDCVIIHDVNNVDLCQTELMEDLGIIDANSLKSGEVNMISNSVVFKGGVVTRSLDVTNECNLNGVDCTRFVSKIHPETLTGVNTVNGMLIADTTTIQNEITASEIEDVNVNFMYTDSLMKSGYQNVAGKAEFSEEIWVENFISNSVSIGSTNAIDLTDSTPFVLNEPGHVVVCGNLVFSQPISVSSVTTDTYNTVPVQTFFNNLWTCNAQVLSGDIHVTSNVAFSKALSSDDGIPTVNEVDIQALNNLAVGITGDSKITLNNVVAEAVASMHDDVGLLLIGSFLGVDLNDAVLWHSSQAAAITGEKRFRNSHIIGNGDFEESTVMSTDQARNPYLTVPNGSLGGKRIWHEGFHIFQYSATSPGFEYGGDSMWYIESSAQWYMAQKMPNDRDIYVEAGAVIGNPQLALWHSFSNEAPGDFGSAEGRPG